MKPIAIACYSLIASAFVLAGLLIVQLDARMEAQASMVIARDNFTVLTARTRNNEESLFVLDNAAQRLLIYRVDIGDESLQPVAIYDLQAIFTGQVGRTD